MARKDTLPDHDDYIEYRRLFESWSNDYGFDSAFAHVGDLFITDWDMGGKAEVDQLVERGKVMLYEIVCERGLDDERFKGFMGVSDALVWYWLGFDEIKQDIWDAE